MHAERCDHVGHFTRVRGSYASELETFVPRDSLRKPCTTVQAMKD